MQDWLNNNLGRGANANTRLNPYPPHSIDGQCVTAGGSWSMAQGGPELWGNGDSSTAYTIWQTFNSDFFERVTSDYQEGDIMFFAPNNPSTGTGNAGHVDVFVKAISGGFQGADMDWGGNLNLQLVNHSFNGIVGAFRAKGGSIVASQDKADETTIRLAYNNGLLRDANQTEVNDMIKGGLTVEQVQRTIINSPEHANIVKVFRGAQGTELKPGTYTVK